jgi:hypothetical protein
MKQKKGTQTLQRRENTREKARNRRLPGVRVDVAPEGVRRPYAVSLYGVKRHSRRVSQWGAGATKGMKCKLRTKTQGRN